jgi:hypothetical protein
MIIPRTERGNGGLIVKWLAGLVILLCTFFVLPSSAHESRPGYLELNELEPGQYDALFKVPSLSGARLRMYAVFPESCVPLTPTSVYTTPGALLERTRITCEGGLVGKTIAIQGLELLITDVLVRIQPIEGAALIHRLTPSASSFVVPAAPSRLEVASTYLGLGVEHILGGIDHLLFVLALLLLVRGFGLLLKTITAFTVAHSITLALATFGFVNIPGAPVEAVIALSILFLASEIAHARAGRAGLTLRYPWVVAFTFGLLHGLGFAGALNEVGLPQGDIPLALFLFNVGVELGQLMFVGTVLVFVTVVRRVRIEWSDWAWQAPAYGIGSVAAFWCIQRVEAFF